MAPQNSLFQSSHSKNTCQYVLTKKNPRIDKFQTAKNPSHIPVTLNPEYLEYPLGVGKGNTKTLVYVEVQCK